MKTESKKKVVEKKSTFDVWGVLRAVGGGAVLVVGVVTIVMMGGAGWVPAKYFWIGAVLWAVLSALVGWGIFKFDKKHVVRGVFAGLGAVVIVMLNMAAISFVNSLNSFFDGIQEPETQIVETKKGEVTAPFVLYISGIDVRSHDLPLKARSDVNILVVVNPEKKTILTVNTPRDFYVDLPNFGGKDKLTHVGTLGVNESVRALEHLYQTQVDYYVRVNFDTLIRLVDTIDGVEVESDYNFKNSGYHFVVGKNSLNGDSALAFSRERKSFSEGDRVRGQHQQLVIEAIFRKMLRADMIVRADSILSALADSLQTNMGADNIRTLIRNQIDEMVDWNVKNIVVNGSGDSQVTYTGGNQKLYVMQPDWSTVEVAREKIVEALTVVD